MSAHQAPREQVDAAVAAYQAGELVKIVSWRFGISVRTFSDWRRRLGVTSRGTLAHIDRARVRELHATGLTDQAIAEQLECSRDSIRKIRSTLGLPANGPSCFQPGNTFGGYETKIDKESARALHGKGLPDALIGKRLGVSRGTVCRWRNRLGLPSNGRKGQRYFIMPLLLLIGSAAQAQGWIPHGIEAPDPFAAMRNIANGKPGFSCCHGEDCGHSEECTPVGGGMGIIGPDQTCHRIPNEAFQVLGCPTLGVTACFIGPRDRLKMICACVGSS